MRIAQLLSVLAIIAFGAYLTQVPAPRAALACSGGVASIEHVAANAGAVFIGDVIAVGSSVNSAPSVTPAPSATPVTPVAGETPPPATAVYGTPDIELAGIGATFQIVTAYAGVSGDRFVIDDALRAGVEHRVREAEAGKLNLTSCAIDAFVVRYTPGARYLVFASPHADGSSYSAAVFRVEGDRILFDDVGLAGGNNGFLYMERATYDRFFAGLPATQLTDESAYFTTGSVPLTTVLRAAGLVEDKIAPPSTGNAGLAAGR